MVANSKLTTSSKVHRWIWTSYYLKYTVLVRPIHNR